MFFGPLLSDLIETLKTSRFSLLSVGLLAVVLFHGQMQDLLRAIADHLPHRSARTAQLLVALWLAGHSNWYFARVMLYFQFPGSPPATPRRLAMARWVPRALGTLPFLLFASAALSARRSLDDGPARNLWLLAGYAVALAVLFVLFVLYRRSLLHRFFGMDEGLGQNPDAELSRLQRGTWIYLGFWYAFGLALLILFLAAAPTVAPWFGPVALVLLTTALWVPLGNTLDYLGRRFRKPVIKFALAIAVVFSWTTDYHFFRSAGPPEPSRPVLPVFRDWLARLPAAAHERPVVFFVAAEGGGIRAAYWTAKVLGGLQDARPSFADHLFAVSAVSGSSLAAVVFDSLLVESGQRARGDRWFQDQAKGVLGEDFLSPAMATALYPDLLLGLLPGSAWYGGRDRAFAIERAWERAWREHVGSDRLGQPFRSLWRQPRHVPHLLLNTTCVESGSRFVISGLKLAPRLTEVADAIESIGLDVPLSTAAHLSARFPYVSPAGRAPRGSEGCSHFVDGGYFENSGAATLLDLLQALPDRIAVEGGASRSYLPVVISINNDPDRTQTPAPSRFLPEVLAPIRASLATRGARGRGAEVALAKYVTGEMEFAERPGECTVLGDDESGYYLEFAVARTCSALGKPSRSVPVPLGWMLSGAAQAQMDCQWETPECVRTREKVAALLR